MQCKLTVVSDGREGSYIGGQTPLEDRGEVFGVVHLDLLRLFPHGVWGSVACGGTAPVLKVEL